MLIKRAQREARRGTLVAGLQVQASGGFDRRNFLRRSGLAAGGLAALGTLPLGSSPQGRGRPAAAARRDGHDPQERLHALLGRLLGHRRGRKRRVDRPGAGLGQPDQSRLALLQGRGSSRRRAERPPPALSDEARERPVEPALVGSGDRRDRRQAAGDPRRSRARIRSTGSAPPNSPTKPPISTASSPRSGERTTPIIRRASVTPPPSPASPIPGATAR